MPLPSTLSAADLVAIIDGTDNAIAWVKDLSQGSDSRSSPIPPSQLLPALHGETFWSPTKNEIFVCYGPKHPQYMPTSNNAKNIAKFSVWERLPTLVPLSKHWVVVQSQRQYVPSWRLPLLRWSLGFSVIESDHAPLQFIEQDQLFGASLMQHILESYDNHKAKLARGFILHQQGSHGRCKDQWICQLSPIYVS
ncbi:hypothetical protein PIIN_10218 [Serendipita indica DSM 11827]|uniref:Uncharacterized protein n=1 Tax=Serendipita indica (strain DSM 11827) TaxID=1109443 RepID=G4TY32_SERID|nr:hypothetical protein PIIN_10218 [Serendipita indica DSM 11827]